MATKSKVVKLVSALLIIAILLPAVSLSRPKVAKASGIPVVDIIHNITSIFNGIFQGTTASSTVVDTALHIKDFAIWLGQQLLKAAAKKLLAEMTQSTINWINDGFHGSPLFLENPDSFFRDIAKSQVRNLVDAIGYDTFRFPFGRQTALNVINSYKSQFEINAQYSLSKVINDPDLLMQYRNDFNYGGWNGFLINTQYPQNNYLGFNMMVQQNLASRLEGTLQAPAQKIQNALQQGMGFLSPQTCPSNDLYNKDTNGFYNQFNQPSFKPVTTKWPSVEEVYGSDPDSMTEEEKTAAQEAAAAKYYEDLAQEESDWAATNTCPGGLVATTPGAVVANQIFSATNTPFLQTALDGALGNSIAAIFDALVNKLASDGLTSLKNRVNPSSTTDNWSYEGNTLSGGYTGGYNASIWNGNVTTSTTGPLLVNSQNPQSIVADINTTTVATIKGGAEPYSILTGSNEVVAIATISSTGLIITGVGKGETYLVIQDSSSTRKTARVNIKVVGPDDLKFDPQNVSVNIDQATSTIIEGGTKPYFVESVADENVAKIPADQRMQISDSTLMITGVAAGQTIIIIKDSSNPSKFGRINITVTDPSNPVGTCVIDGEINNDVTESDCRDNGGNWTP